MNTHPKKGLLSGGNRKEAWEKAREMHVAAQGAQSPPRASRPGPTSALVEGEGKSGDFSLMYKCEIQAGLSAGAGDRVFAHLGMGHRESVWTRVHLDVGGHTSVDIWTQEGYPSVHMFLFWGCLLWGEVAEWIYMRRKRLCLKVTTYTGYGMFVLHIGHVPKRQGDPGGPQPSPGSSELLARPVPGHLGSARALWCAGEKWKC